MPAVKGWTFEEMVFLYGFSLIPLGIFNVLSWNLYLFPDRYLIEGRFDRVLVRPVSSVFQVLFEAFRLESLQETRDRARRGRLGLAPPAPGVLGPSTSLLFVLWAACGAAIYLAIFIGLTATSFWIEDRIGIVPPVFNLMQFGRYPLTIYDAWIRFTLSFVIPFAFASFYPDDPLPQASGVRPRNSGPFPLVAAVTVSIALVAWNVRRQAIPLDGVVRSPPSPPAGGRGSW